jgi:hypothetical protein
VAGDRRTPRPRSTTRLVLDAAQDLGAADLALDDVGDSHRGRGERQAPAVNVEQRRRMEVAIAVAGPQAPAHGHRVERVTAVREDDTLGSRGRARPWALTGNTRRARGSAARTSRGRARRGALRLDGPLKHAAAERSSRCRTATGPAAGAPAVGLPLREVSGRTARGSFTRRERAMLIAGGFPTLPIVQLMCSLASAVDDGGMLGPVETGAHP